MGSQVAEKDFKSLLTELTLEEKVTLLSGRDFSTAAGVARVGIPPIKVCMFRDAVAHESQRGANGSLPGCRLHRRCPAVRAVDGYDDSLLPQHYMPWFDMGRRAARPARRTTRQPGAHEERAGCSGAYHQHSPRPPRRAQL